MVETGRNYGGIVGTETSAIVFNGSSGYRKEDAAKKNRAAWIFEGSKDGDVCGDSHGMDRVHGGVVDLEIDRYSASNCVRGNR